ncbi:SMP-30/gluconolactonase/LRE family protein [Planococcus sp. CPCC 101016]|uniref:SMP-30/gluconolactonase/LRE family protein n=1 Tax=Planococcus sp. CPCC 101016 TaxID=2599617 RepID=UPI0011B85DE3|nr:SMP-30/gluconolactonase/LRE family protein [Planococcus sp. CPCC 101016]TWT07973.1 SMP-30/gluconolactonase/LRE family protein [Planococcus sp. CPCC 101016]
MRSKKVISALIDLRGDVPHTQKIDFWRGPYAQKAARINGVLEYRQHHFITNQPGHWPTIFRVDTVVQPLSRIDGMEEYVLKPATANRHRKLTGIYGETVFADRVLYQSNVESCRTLRHCTRHPQTTYREIVLIRRKPSVRLDDFQSFIQNNLAPAIAEVSGFSEVRYQLFDVSQKKRNTDLWDYNAMLVLGAADASTFLEALESPSFLGTLRGQEKQCAAIHAYPVEVSYVFTKAGRPTLPQTKPQPKPTLTPVRRRLPPAPRRATRKSGRTPFPRAWRIPLSGYGPEDVVVDDQGRLICGVEDGRILRIDPEQHLEETIGDTGGRPLGLEVLPDGRLLVCDAHKGLLRLNTKTGVIETLVQYVEGVPLRFCSNAATESDGTIWFTESSNRYDFEQYTGALMEHRPSGRLFRRDPDGRIEVVLEDLHFANGLTLSSGEQAVIFAETDGYRLNRLWIRGPQAGKREILAANLPGFPDNISRLKDSKFWVAMMTNRNPLLDRLGTAPVFLRKLLWRVPERLQPKPAKTAWAMLFDEQGNCLLDLQSSTIDYHAVTGVVESRGMLYFASIEEQALLAVELMPDKNRNNSARS